MKTDTASNPILEYIAAQEQSIREKLLIIRSIIIAVDPELEEKIAWGMPTFRKKNIIHFAAHKAHIGIYPGPNTIVEFAHRIAKYKSSKGAFQIPYTSEIDIKLIEDIVRYNLLRDGDI